MTKKEYLNQLVYFLHNLVMKIEDSEIDKTIQSSFSEKSILDYLQNESNLFTKKIVPIHKYAITFLIDAGLLQHDLKLNGHDVNYLSAKDISSVILNADNVLKRMKEKKEVVL